MKTIFNKFLALSSLGLLMLSACKKEGALVTTSGIKAGALTASSTTPILDRTKLDDTSAVIRFNFTAANFGYSAAVTNTLQIDAPGDNWANPATAVFPYKAYSQGYSVAAFNKLLLKLNLPAGAASQVQVRVAHSLSTAVAPIYSNVLTLTATPFNLTSWVYITGQFSGWQNPGPQEDSLVSVTGNGIYTGVINFTAGNNQFLILPAKNWNNKYATSGSSTPSTTVAYNASNNLNAPAAAGQYLVTFNLSAGTITFTRANSYSIIGDAALGWGTDYQMKYVNDGSDTWTATLPLVSTGQFKVRQNNDWTYSWGVPKTGTAGDGTPGALNDSSNNNIAVGTTGTHTVTFTIPLTTAGTNPPITASYTLK
ncbi:MAG: SusE domain-containing protein [Bacteroidota bacterium]|nr:SusE domain-containing protein [Bacteroidota bacterium]